MIATTISGPPSAKAAARDNREKMIERAMTKHNYSGGGLIEVPHTAQGLYGFLTMPLLGNWQDWSKSWILK